MVHFPPANTEMLSVILPRSKPPPPLVHQPLTPLTFAGTVFAPVLSSFSISLPTSLDHSHQQINKQPSYLPPLIKTLFMPHPALANIPAFHYPLYPLSGLSLALRILTSQGHYDCFPLGSPSLIPSGLCFNVTLSQ